MQSSKHLLVAIASLAAAASAAAGSFTATSDRAAFEAALTEPYLVETFGDCCAFPISTGVLNAATNLATDSGPILPGRILPGVTYSTPVGTGYFFNIDGGGGFDGGFLDGFYGDNPQRRLTISFDKPVEGFGFDTNDLARNLEVVVRFSDGTSQGFSTTVSNFSFYGFTGIDGARITSAVIGGDNNGTFAFAVDNVTYTGMVPEPATWGLLAVGLLGVATRVRRRG